MTTQGPAPFPTPQPTPSARLVHTVEFLAFLSLLVPSYVLSFFASQATSEPFVQVATATVLRDLSLLALVGFFLWRNGDSLGTIGWTRAYAGREALLGFALFLPVSAVAGALAAGLRGLGLSMPEHARAALTPAPGAQEILAVVLVVVVAVAEETIFRGYMLSRLREATGSTALAVVLSATLFALGHSYEGTAGMILVGYLGVVFAVVYLWRGSLVAPVAMHFCQDFLSIVLVPHLPHAR